jgi:mono/diheme cytochrome c family protein
MGGNHLRFTWMTGTFGIACASGIALSAVLIQTVCGTVMAAIPPAAKREVDFIKDVQPLFKEHCYKCHGSSRQEGGLRLDRRDDALNGGDGGPVFVTGKSEESKLIKYVAAVDPDVVMPPEGDKLSDEQIGLLRAWIDQGAKWPKD